MKPAKPRVYHRGLLTRRGAVVVLILTALAITAANWWWLQIDQRPPHWDMGRHLYTSLGYLDSFKGHRVARWFLEYNYYPPLLYWMVVPWYLAFGAGATVAVLANLPFVLLLLLSVYATGRFLWGRLVGVTAAIVTIATPMLTTQFKEFQIDAPLTSLTAATLYVLIRSKEFSARWWTPAVGVMVGLGLLCKWTFALILGLPLAWAAGVAIWQAVRERSWQRISGMLVAGLLAYAIPIAWYSKNSEQIRIDLLSNGVGAGIREGDPVVGSLASNIWYLLNLINVQLYLILAVALIVGIVVLLRHRQEWWRARYLILGVVGILVLFTLLRNKDARYTLPMVPMVVLLGCAGISYARGYLRQIWAGLLIAYSLVAFVVISFGWPWQSPDVAFGALRQRWVIVAEHGYIIGAPAKDDWHQEEAFQVMALKPGGVTFSGIDSMWFNNWGAMYYGRLYRVPVVPDEKDARYLLLRSFENPPVEGWTLLKSYTLPDRTRLFLYQRPEQI